MTGIFAAVAAADGINKVVGLTRTITELVKKGASLELQERITDLREAVLDAKDEVLALREENQALRDRLSQQDKWTERASAYKLVKTAAGAVVLHTSAPPEHFACPACFEEQKIRFLQDTNAFTGEFVCSGCGKKFPLRKPRGVAAAKPDIVIEK